MVADIFQDFDQPSIQKILATPLYSSFAENVLIVLVMAADM